MHGSGDGFEHYGQRPYQEFATRRKIFRRRRTYTGTEFVDHQQQEVEALEAAKRSDSGLYCKSCRTRRNWKQVKSQYTKVGTDIIRLWYCDQCGSGLREDNMEKLA